MSFNWKEIAGDKNQHKCQGAVASPKGQNKRTETVPENDTSDSAVPAISGYIAMRIYSSLQLAGKDGKTASQRAGD